MQFYNEISQTEHLRMSDFSDNYININIVAFLKANGVSQTDFAKRIKVTPQTVSKWIAGKGSPSKKLLPALCEVTGFNIHELQNEDLTERIILNIKNKSNKNVIFEKDNTTNIEDIESPAILHNILIIKKVPTNTIKINSKTDYGNLPIAASLLGENPNPDDYIAFPVRDTAMGIRYKKGDSIVGLRIEKEKCGQYVESPVIIVKSSGEFIFRFLSKFENGTVTLMPMLIAEYEPEEIPLSEISSFYVAKAGAFAII